MKKKSKSVVKKKTKEVKVVRRDFGSRGDMPSEKASASDLWTKGIVSKPRKEVFKSEEDRLRKKLERFSGGQWPQIQKQIQEEPKEVIENSDNYSTNSQNSLMDNSEKQILTNRIIHSQNAGVSQQQMRNVQIKELPPMPKKAQETTSKLVVQNVQKQKEAPVQKIIISKPEEINSNAYFVYGNQPQETKSNKTEKKAEPKEKTNEIKDEVKVEKKGEVKKHGKVDEKEIEERKLKEVEQEVASELIKGKHPEIKRNERILENYEIEVDGAKVKVEIKRDLLGMSYNIYLPKISPATATLLDEIRNELISISTVSMQELTDPAAFNSIKERFISDARNILKGKLPNINQEVESFLVGILMQEMLGLGSIEFLIDDPSLEEIVIPSAKENIRVYSKKYGWLLTNIKIEKEEEIVNYSNIIARRVGRQITVLSPLLDAHLVTGDRVNAVLYPIGTKGNTITVRKFSRDPFTIVDFINNKTCDVEIAALLWLAIEFEMNILISGGTGSGKTSFLNACMPFVQPNQRIISIEDTRELMLPEFLYWTPLVTRTSNPEGKGEVSMLDLLVNSLRMRPDRIILGEMRKQQEAMVLFEAMHTGHSVYATVHADTAAETISRLVNPPLNVPPNLLKAVNLNVVMFRDRRKGIRRVLQIAEYEAGKDSARANILYRWVREEDKLKAHSESSRFFEDISRNTGMSDTEIRKEIDEKKKILMWLIKKGIRDLESVGKVISFYYRNKELLFRAMSLNDVNLILAGR